MAFLFNIPAQRQQIEITAEPGSSVVFVGANGGGKTRLAAFLEESLGLQAHRISAHRALTLNPAVAKITGAATRFAWTTNRARPRERVDPKQAIEPMGQ